MCRALPSGGRTYALPMKTVSCDVGKEVRPGKGSALRNSKPLTA